VCAAAARGVSLDPSDPRRVGTIQYPETIPVEEGDIVLTFDDGPRPPYSAQVLDVLAAEGVSATFFLVGQMAGRYPELAARVVAEGHTIGTHSHSHPTPFQDLAVERAIKEIELGIAAVGAAVGGTERLAPFFRFPGLGRSSVLEAYLHKRLISSWSADVVADDWKPIAVEEVVDTAIRGMIRKKRGILLLHDVRQRTALALPYLISELRRRQFQFVRVELNRVLWSPNPIPIIRK
jgi:peptidoglycan-N-acetylglucosamine deacetylase